MPLFPWAVTPQLWSFARVGHDLEPRHDFCFDGWWSKVVKGHSGLFLPGPETFWKWSRWFPDPDTQILKTYAAEEPYAPSETAPALIGHESRCSVVRTLRHVQSSVAPKGMISKVPCPWRRLMRGCPQREGVPRSPPSAAAGSTHAALARDAARPGLALHLGTVYCQSQRSAHWLV